MAELVGAGAQAEVYRGFLEGGEAVALKWYFDSYLKSDTRLQRRLEKAISIGAPDNRFLWPRETASSVQLPGGFGYIMNLQNPRYVTVAHVLAGRAVPTYRALSLAGFQIADSMLQLHSQGLCYRDINYRNISLDPATGDVAICDNDNVDVDGQDGPIGGTPLFMAPELILEEAKPTTQTDLHALAVLLFYLLVKAHPLCDGRRADAFVCLDILALLHLGGTHPVFLFDPDDDSNRPFQSKTSENTTLAWKVLPGFVRTLFLQAFTKGLRAAIHERVRENEWREAMARMHDLIIECPDCHAESIFDPDLDTSPGQCWYCYGVLSRPRTLEIHHGGRRYQTVVLTEGARLFPHHTNERHAHDFSRSVGQVLAVTPHEVELRNLSGNKWTVTDPRNSLLDAPPGAMFKLRKGCKLYFGTASGTLA